MTNKTLLIIFSIVFLVSCKSPNNYETFFIGKNEYQYFIKPLELSGEGADLFVDYTIKILNDKQYATMNFTVESDKNTGSCQNITYLLNDIKLEYSEIDEFYFEKKGNFIYRSSTDIPIDDFIKIFEFISFEILYEGSLNNIKFKLKNSSIKKINEINTDLIPFIKTKI